MKTEGSLPTLILAPAKVRNRLRSALTLAGGFQVASAEEGAVLALVHEQAAGEGEGPAWVPRLLARGVRAVLALAPENSPVRLAFIESGADDVVSTEVTEAELLLRLKALIRLAVLRGKYQEMEIAVREGLREVEESRALFQAVVDALPMSLYAIDRRFDIVVWNRAREVGPFGRPRGEVLGKNLIGITGEDPALYREFEKVFREGVGLVSEVEGRAVDPPRLFRVEKVPMRLGGGDEVTHVITFARDITEQRAIERTLAQTEKLAAIGQLSAGIAHEIKNPLMTIASCAEAMKNRLSSPVDETTRDEIVQDAQLIEDEAYRCKEILDGLLDFSRASTNQRRPVDPNELGAKVCHLLRYNPRLKGVHLELQAEPGLPELHANPDQIMQALLVLILNAVDAAGPSGRVILETRRGSPTEVVLAVEDNGPGIPPEIRERIFEPFFTTKPPGKGTGLGLGVAYGLITAHGGRFQVHSKQGQGTRFEIWLPVPRDETVSEESREAEVSP